MDNKHKAKYLPDSHRLTLVGTIKSVVSSVLILSVLVFLLVKLLNHLGIAFNLTIFIVFLLSVGIFITILFPIFYILFKRQNNSETDLLNEYKQSLQKVSSHVKKYNKNLSKDSFNKQFLAASKQLWHPNIQYRLAGVASIVALADEWGKKGKLAKRDTCIDLLCGYLRGKPPYFNPPLEEIEPIHDTQPLSETNTNEMLDAQIRDEICKQIAYHVVAQISPNRSSWSDHDFDFSNCIFHDVDFSDAVFLNKINFSHASFMGKAIFKKSDFQDTVSFSASNFRNHTSFIATNFAQKTNFIGAKFGDNTLFIGAHFQKEINFNHTIFGNKTDFINAQFNDLTDFNGTNFGNDTSFIGCDFIAPVFFNGAKFGKNIFFTNSAFSEKTFFIKANFAYNVDFTGASINNMPIGVEEVRQLLNPCAHPPHEFSLMPLLISDFDTLTPTNSLADEIITFPWNS